MQRKDVTRMLQQLKTDDDKEFEHVAKVVQEIGSKAIQSKDSVTAHEIIDAVEDAFWFWDEKIPEIPEWKKIPEGELESYVDLRVKAKSRMGRLAEAMEVMHAYADKVHSGKRSDVAVKARDRLDNMMSRWELIYDTEIAKRYAKLGKPVKAIQEKPALVAKPVKIVKAAKPAAKKAKKPAKKAAKKAKAKKKTGKAGKKKR